MLSNFLQHTRCPETLVEPLLFNSREQSVDDKNIPKVFGNEKINTEWFPPSEGERLVASVRRYLDGDSLAVTPSDLNAAIGVLHLEQYVDNAVQYESQSLIKQFIRQTYYAMRPLFPVSFRKYLQRTALRGWDTIPFPSWPVDLTTEQIMESIWKLLLRSQDINEIPFIWFWPMGYESCCIMTHDVETMAGRDFCRAMMQMESQYGINSAFEIVPEERYEVPHDFLQQIREAGCEVCIHGLNHDGHLFSSNRIFFERAEKINRYAEDWGVIGFRSPVLYRNLKWLYALKFSYDMSVPNVGHLDPQRGGCCSVMPYFISDILELPLTTIQDYSLYHILQQRSLDLWKQQIGMIQERHGLISFIIHPDYSTDTWSRKLYDALLEYLANLRSDSELWIALPREVDSWWRARTSMELVNQDGRWRIRGPQAERARIAYASIENDRIVYRIDQEEAIAVHRQASELDRHALDSP